LSERNFDLVKKCIQLKNEYEVWIWKYLYQKLKRIPCWIWLMK
jgi:hypothetical protein